LTKTYGGVAYAMEKGAKIKLPTTSGASLETRKKLVEGITVSVTDREEVSNGKTYKLNGVRPFNNGNIVEFDNSKNYGYRATEEITVNNVKYFSLAGKWYRETDFVREWYQDAGNHYFTL
jgi:hypothetical protein